MKNTIIMRSLAAAGMSVFAMNATFAAQTSILEEVIVTAQKRQKSMQDVTASITAMDADMLSTFGVDRVEDISALAPNVDVNRAINIVNIYVRGIGGSFLSPGADGSVAVHIDEAYIQSPRALRSGFYDIDRIEVLRGPQGTLYGRNATGGSVNIITRKPTEQLEGYGKLTSGNYNRAEFEGAVGGSIADNLMGRISVSYKDRDGYGENLFNGKEIDNLEERGIRGQLLYEPTDSLSLAMTVDTFDAESDGMGWHSLGRGRDDVPLLGIALGGETSDDIRDVNQNVHPSDKLDLTRYNLTVSYDLSDQWVLKSVSAYNKMDSENQTENDNTNLALGGPLVQSVESKWFSQELQASYSSDRLTAIMGLYYFTQDIESLVSIDFTGRLEFIESITPLTFPNKFLHQSGTLDTDAYAAFANFEYQLTDRLTATLGMRYSYEKKDTLGNELLPVPVPPFPTFSFPVVGDRSWNSFDPEFTLDYDFSDEVMAYIKYSQGFKSGTFMIGTSNGLDITGQQYVEPEEITAYEIGLKSRLFDNRLQANMAFFHYSFDNMQINRIVANSVFVQNISDATMKGVELELLAQLTDSTEGVLSIGHVSSEFGDAVISDPVFNDAPVNIRGNRVPGAPDWSVNLVLVQHMSLGDYGNLDFSVQGKWQDDKYFTVFERDNEYQPAYAEVGANATWTSVDEAWSVSLWGRNLTDKEAISLSTITTPGLGYPIIGTVNEPRTYGVDVHFKF